MNRKQILTYFFILCILFSHNSPLEAAPTFQYENKPIEKIEIIMMNCAEGSQDDNSVCGRMKTKQGDLFSQGDFDADLKKLSLDFDRVEPQINCGNESMQITLKIWPKPIIRSIHWSGNQKMRTKKLKAELEILPGKVFDRVEFNNAFHKLKAFYVKKGFFEAQLEYVVDIDPNCNEVDIDIVINEGRAGKIKEIIFKNFASCEETELLEMMATKKYNFFLSWFTQEGTYNEEAVQQDQFNIVNYLHNRGFADAKVKIDVCEAPQDDRIILYINLDRGPMYTFGKLTLEGNQIFCTEDVLKHITFCEGDAYSPEQVRKSITAISDLYGRRGYIDALIDFQPIVNCETLTYDVKMVIEEDEQYFVGLIKVFGNCSTQTNVILHETILIPGEVFNIDKLQKTEERLTNVGYFKTVNVYAVKSEGSCELGGNFRDVHIEVEETSTGSFGAFLGYSTVEALFCGLNVTEKNFNYQGLTSFWCDGYQALRGGGEYAHMTATIGTKSRKYVFSWTKPYFMDTPWAVGFDVEKSNNRYISRDYEINASGVNLHGTYVVNPFIKFGVHYRIKNTDIHVSHDASNLLRDEADNCGIISAVGVSLIYDATDHPATPTCGFRSRFDVEYAGVGGKHRFLSTSYLNSYYIPIFETGVLKFRGDVRFIQPITDTTAHTIPIDERFFLGGDNTIRGYKSYRLGPMYDTGDPRGGISLQILSVEYTRFIFKRLEGFIFTDAGHLSLEPWHVGRMSVSSGFGCRVKIMECAPPVTLGMGFPINPRNRSEVKKFFMTIGGRF